MILIENLNVFDVFNGTFLPDHKILIDKDRIEYVGNSIDTSPAMELIDATGKYALPGLFECHAHLASHNTLADDKRIAMLSEFVHRGITQVRDVGGPLDLLQSMKSAIDRGDFSGPEIFYSGPMLEKSPPAWSEVNKELPGFTVPIDTEADAISMIQQLLDKGARLVKTFNKFDRPVFERLVSEASAASLPVVHDPGTPLFNHIPMDMAIDTGIRSIEHAKAPWPVVLQDDLKLEHDGLMSLKASGEKKHAFVRKLLELGLKSINTSQLDRLIEKMLELCVYFCPTLHVFQVNEHPADPGSAEERLRQNRAMETVRLISEFFIRRMADRNIRFLVGHDGNDSANTFSEMNLLNQAGLSETDIILAATLHPAQWLGKTHEYGVISPGRFANILIVNENPLNNIQNLKRTWMVFNKGSRITPSRELDPM